MLFSKFNITNGRPKRKRRAVATLLVLTLLMSCLPVNIFNIKANGPSRIPSNYYTASFMYHSQWHGDTEFSHGILIDNHSNHVIRNWQVHFELDNGTVQTVSHEAVIVSNSGTVIIDQAGGGQQVWPGPSLYLTIGGIAAGETINPQNIRLYGVIGEVSGGGSPATPGVPNSPERHQLFITTNAYGNAFTHDTQFHAGETFEIVALPHVGNFLSSWTYSAGTLVHRNGFGFVFDFIMPDSSATIHFEFVEGIELDESGWDFDFNQQEPDLRIRRFTDNDVIHSTRYPNFRFVQGELIIIAHPNITYQDMSELVNSLNGEIVGFLSPTNTFQLYFPNTSEMALWNLYDTFNSHSYIDVVILNGAATLDLPSSSPWRSNSFTPEPSPQLLRPMAGETDEDDPYSHGIVLPSLLQSPVYLPTSNVRWTDEWSDFERGQVGGLNWGVETINAPAVWYYKQRYPDIFHPISIGFIDSFFPNHDDVEITTFYDNPPEDSTDNHGTQVASVALASHNDIGIVGVAWNAEAYGYALHGSEITSSFTSAMDVKHALSVLFNQDIRLINISMGWPPHEGAGNNFNLSSYRWLEDESRSLTAFLNRYLSRGHDFLLIQSGGNSGNAIDSRYGGLFRNITHPDLANRIIIVGNLEGRGALVQQGSFQVSDLVTDFRVSLIQQLGPRIDILAPGTDIDTATRGNQHMTTSGASFATPHVTGVAGLLWSVNPNLTAVQVRNLILDNPHPDINIIVPGGQSIDVLYAPTAFRLARSMSGDYSSSNLTYSTILGEVRLSENVGQTAQPNLHSQLAIEIYRYPSWELIDTITVTNHDADGRNIIEHIMPRDRYILRFLMNGRLDQFIPLDTRHAYPFLLVYMEAGRDIIIQIDGVNVSNIPNTDFLVPRPFIENSRALVPMRAVSEFADFNVRWYPQGQRIVVYRRISVGFYHQAELSIDSASFVSITRNISSIETSETLPLEYGVPPRLVDGVTFMPIRDVGQIMGYDVDWHSDLALATLTSRRARGFNQNVRTQIGSIEW